MRELRRCLKRLEEEGRLVKGYILRGSGVLHWVSIEAYKSLGKTSFSETFVLSPGDMFTQYLRASFRDMLPETGRFAIFRGTKLVGSFEGKLREGILEVADARGEADCEEIIAEYAKKLGLATAEREEGRMSEWEIIDFYQRTHPGAGTD
jgi:hypothetical protein